MNLLADLATALAALSERELLGLRAALDGSPNVVPGLLAWLEHAVGWEMDRRTGAIYSLRDPHAAIDDTEIHESLITLAVLTACFWDDGRIDSVPIANFLELTATILRAEVERPDTLQ
jgi:hypothetical protein